VVVPEKSACPPDGYPAYTRDPETGQLIFMDSGGNLTLDDAENLRHVFAKYSVNLQLTPWTTVALGDEIGTLMKRYPQPPGNNPERRFALIFLFHVSGGESQPITFQRTQVGVPKRTIPDNVWQGTVGDKGNWMNHQRADTILPRNNVLFAVTVGDRIWRFNAGV